MLFCYALQTGAAPVNLMINAAQPDGELVAINILRHNILSHKKPENF